VHRRYAQSQHLPGSSSHALRPRGGAVRSATFSSSMNNAKLATAPAHSMPRAPRSVTKPPKFVTPSPQHYGDVAAARDRLSHVKSAPQFTIGVKLKDDREIAESLGYGTSSVPAPGGSTRVPRYARHPRPLSHVWELSPPQGHHSVFFLLTTWVMWHACVRGKYYCVRSFAYDDQVEGKGGTCEHLEASRLM